MHREGKKKVHIIRVEMVDEWHMLSKPAQSGIMGTKIKQRWPLFYALLYAHKHGLLLCFVTYYFDGAGYRAGTGVEEEERWSEGLGRTRPGHSSQNEHRVYSTKLIFPAPFKMKPIGQPNPNVDIQTESSILHLHTFWLMLSLVVRLG